jgi:hypothetical protein
MEQSRGLFIALMSHMSANTINQQTLRSAFAATVETADHSGLVASVDTTDNLLIAVTTSSVPTESKEAEEIISEPLESLQLKMQKLREWKYWLKWDHSIKN